MVGYPVAMIWYAVQFAVIGVVSYYLMMVVEPPVQTNVAMLAGFFIALLVTGLSARFVDWYRTRGASNREQAAGNRSSGVGPRVHAGDGPQHVRRPRIGNDPR